MLKGRLSHKWGVVKNIYFFNLPAKFSIIRNYWVIRRLRTVLTFSSIIYCNKTTYYSNFDYPKNSIFRSDLSAPIKEMAIKLPFKIRSPNVTHGDHDFFVWSSLFLLYRLIIRKKIGECHYNNTSSVLTWSIVIYSMDVGDLILNETIQI